MTPATRHVFLATLIGLVLTGSGRAQVRRTLQSELVAQARALLPELQKRYQNVGVLKFLVETPATPKAHALETRPGARPEQLRGSFVAGPLNMNLANRLEFALIAALDPKAVGNFRLLRQASARAAKVPAAQDASWLNSAGRSQLFQQTYPTAWGSAEVRADAFVTGIAHLSPKLDQLQIELVLLDANGLEKKSAFAVATNSALLLEAGQTFALRNYVAANGNFQAKGELVFANNNQKDQAVVQAAQQAQTAPPSPAKEVQKANNAVAVPAVELKIYYDDQPQPIEKIEGALNVLEPNQGQKVKLELIRNDNSTNDIYGVALLVNGVDTLTSEPRSPDQCRKWILGPGADPVPVTAFYRLQQKVRADGQAGLEIVRAPGQEFFVSSLEDSDRNEVKYGKDVGTITCVVYRSNGPAAPVEGPSESFVKRGIQLESSQPKDLAELKSKLFSGSYKIESRGLVEPGRDVAQFFNIVTFANPSEVAGFTITYRQKKAPPPPPPAK